MTESHIHPSRKILLVVTNGGFTHAAPVLELGRNLAERGHIIEFATLEGQQGWIEEYPFVSKLYILGPGPTTEQCDAHYRRMQAWDISRGVGKAIGSKYMNDSFWPATYHGLKKIMDDPATRPAAIVADFFVEAANDIHFEYNVALAIVSPTMPAFQLPCSYIPGQPGFQLPGTLTSETASLWLRIRNELFFIPGLCRVIKAARWTRKLRRDNGVFRPLHKPRKPDYLIFVNSFFGLEVPRDLPPTCAPVGPLLSPTFPPLDEKCGMFLSRHRSVLYIALGTHVILPHRDIIKILNGIVRLMDERLIDGVIWAMGKTCRADVDRQAVLTMPNSTNAKSDSISLGDLLDNKHSQFMFPFFAPQRAILDHDSTRLYFTHGGGSSANEGLFHGVPMLSMGIFSDQISNTTRLVAGGVAESLSKLGFTADELSEKAQKILSDDSGSYQRNVLRLQRIAHVAARRRYHATDLIEELMYDNELRFSVDGGTELRPMHLQTADMRMPFYKAQNWDLYALGALCMLGLVGSTWFVAQSLWLQRITLKNMTCAIFDKCWQVLSRSQG